MVHIGSTLVYTATQEIQKLILKKTKSPNLTFSSWLEIDTSCIWPRALRAFSLCAGVCSRPLSFSRNPAIERNGC
jgi:hypothetical protein